MFNAAEPVTGKNSKSCNGLLYPPTQTNSSKTPSHRIIHPSEKQDLHRLSNHQLSSSASSSRTIINGFEDKHSNRQSHTTGSIMQPNKGDSFFDMLQDYKPAVLGVIGTNQRSPGPAEFMQDREIQKSTQPSNKETQLNANTNANANQKTSDPKVKNKIHRFLVQTTKPKTEDNALVNLSMLAKNVSIDEVSKQSHLSSLKKKTFLSTEEMEEQQRQRIFTHYDCQSMAASILYAKIIKNLSTINHNGSSKSLDSMLPASKNPHLPDFNQGNELLENCPHYFNEISGDNESRMNLKRSNSIELNGCVPRSPRRPMTPCSVSILESLPNETLWRGGVCPFQDDSCPIESVDHGAHYYKRYFCNEKHENWFGIDGNLGPTAISIKKEKKLDSGNNSGSDQQRQSQSQTRYQFRIIIRTSELLTLRGLVIEDCIINSRASGKSVTSKELLEYVAPDIQLNCFRLGVNTPNCEQQLLKLDEQGLQNKYKVGILYCRSGQSSEEDMYNNEHAGPAFTEFLEIIGKRVRLKNFQQYKAGLDNKSDSTGTHSVYAFYKNCEIMFHVCTMLPFTPNNRQQLLRKRHIGNDIVTIIFQEPGALPFVPTNIRSQFQHVFLIVRAVNPCSSNTTYRVAITRSKEVPVFGPPLPGLFARNSIFTEFILAKVMNAENAAHRSEKFANLAIRTRREYLKDLCINYCTSTPLDPGNKFSIFANKKKEKMKTFFSGDVSQRGAICWRIMLQDHGLNIATECLLGISIETFVIIEESSKTLVFAMPTRSILGWSTCDIFFRIFYHNGECITMNMRYIGGVDEQLQVIDRLRAVTLGNGALELNIRRNMMGQLGFHVQPDGIVTQVDATGQAWAAGLRRGYRLVEVCKIVVATLSYTELIDLLKTSAQMNAIVIKSIADETPRLGCFDKNCKVNLLCHELDYSSSSNKMFSEKDNYSVKHLFRKESGQHPVLNYRRSGTYEQRSLPHKSKTCSGYNTGSSCFSTNSLDEHKKILQQSSISSLQSLKNNKWCPLDDPEQMLKTSYALNHDYPLKSFEHSSKYEDTSDLTKPPTPSSSSLHEGLKVESWLQNDRSNFSPTLCAKLQHRNHKYDLIEFKHVNVSPTHSYTLENSHPMSPETSKLNSGLSFKNKNTFHELDAFASPSKVKTAKVAQSVKSFNTTVNSSKQSTSYPCRTKLFPSDFEIMSPNLSSYYDSLKTKSFPVVKRDPSPRMLDDSISSSLSITNTPKQSVKHEKLEGVSSSSASVKRHQHIPSPIGTATRIKQISGQDHHKNALSATLPVLQYSKELDWTTLVDTATKAIILQHKDENSCFFFFRKLKAHTLHIIVPPKTPGFRKEFPEANLRL